MPKGINLRKEAQKIDLRQFNSNDVTHVEPIISVMRPHEGIREEQEAMRAAELEQFSEGAIPQTADGDKKRGR